PVARRVCGLPGPPRRRGRARRRRRAASDRVHREGRDVRQHRGPSAAHAPGGGCARRGARRLEDHPRAVGRRRSALGLRRRRRAACAHGRRVPGAGQPRRAGADVARGCAAGPGAPAQVRRPRDRQHQHVVCYRRLLHDRCDFARIAHHGQSIGHGSTAATTTTTVSSIGRRRRRGQCLNV
ncbi:hypothetical protein GGF44_004831, partial [Coemansia sp. RSA 1694]